MNYGRTHTTLQQWYRVHGRKDLPWRNTHDPYAIWVSEIMLQQTQVRTVRDRYYSLFLNRFSTLVALAEAPRDAVLKAWQGMGYYQRAVNLHKAAQLLCGGNRGPGFRGQLPETVEELKKLPGIGENTARAIAAFAFHQPVAVMEANVKRVLSRVFALRNPSPKVLFAKADVLLDRGRPFDHNQAMMDVGALVCVPKAPKCGECPLAAICVGRKAPERYPARKKRTRVPLRKKIIVIFQDAAGKYFVEPRVGRFLHGLYGFAEFTPGVAIRLGEERHRKKELTQLGRVTHSYSHFRLDAEVYLARVEGKRRGERWKSAVALEKLPLSRADTKALALLKNHLSAS